MSVPAALAGKGEGTAPRKLSWGGGDTPGGRREEMGLRRNGVRKSGREEKCVRSGGEEK